MATLKIVPVPERLPELRAALNGRFLKAVYMYTHCEGVITLHGTVAGTLADIARLLEREGLTVQSSR